VIGVFLGILELCRLRRVKFEQARQFGEIYLMLGEEGDSEIELPDDAEMGYAAAETAEPPADAQAASEAGSTADAPEDRGDELVANFDDDEVSSEISALAAITESGDWSYPAQTDEAAGDRAPEAHQEGSPEDDKASGEAGDSRQDTQEQT